MSKLTRYNKNYTSPVQITDEFYQDVGASLFQLGSQKRSFKGSTDLVIRTASGGGGTLLVETTDYDLTLDTKLTAEAGFNVYSGITVTNVTYQTGTLFMTYETPGTYTNANIFQTGIHRQAIINGNMEVAQRDFPNLSTSFQYGEADRIAAKGSGSAVSAGTIRQTQAANIGVSGFAFKIVSATITGTGIAHFRYRMEAKDARQFKNKNISLSILVYHDVGSAINYTIYLNKADAADDFSSVTAIENDGGRSIPDATEKLLIYEDVSIGDASNGIEIEIQAECGAITTKNFEFAEFQFNEGSAALPFQPKLYDIERALCQRYYEQIDIGSGQELYMPAGQNAAGTVDFGSWEIAEKRDDPAVTFIGTANTNYRVLSAAGSAQTGFSFSGTLSGKQWITIIGTKGSHGLTSPVLQFQNNSGIIIDAEFNG